MPNVVLTSDNFAFDKFTFAVSYAVVEPDIIL